jgi:SAM-dependent methyltransferase
MSTHPPDANRYSPTWQALFGTRDVNDVHLAREIDFITQWFPLDTYPSLLDVCCGRAVHAQRLAQRGYAVTGIDRDASVIDAATREKPTNRTLHCMDVRELDQLPRMFDGVLCLWQSFGYHDADTNRATLLSMANRLRHRGRLLLDLYHPEFFAQRPPQRSFTRDGVVVHESISLSAQRLCVNLTYDDRSERDAFDWQVYAPHELATLAESVGLRTIAQHADWDVHSSPGAEHARYQSIVERRP